MSLTKDSNLANLNSVDYSDATSKSNPVFENKYYFGH